MTSIETEKKSKSISLDKVMKRELQNPEFAENYLFGALEAFQEDGHTEAFLLALRRLAQAKGMSEVAEQAEMKRPNLYRTLSENGNPGLSTLNRVIGALGYRLTLERSPSDATLSS